METSHYLVDFENVGIRGLEGAEKLSSKDYVHIFSTKNAPKITTATLSTFNKTNLKVHEVPVKKQSVDMHLVSFLGFLIGKNGISSKYIIISKDNDYKNIIKYWEKENNSSITYQENFYLKQTNSNSKNLEEKRKRKSTTNSPIINVKNNELDKLNASIRKELKCYNLTKNEREKIIMIISTFYGKDNFLMNVHNELQKYNLSSVYDVIKSLVSTPSLSSSKSENSIVQPEIFDTHFVFERFTTTNVKKKYNKLNNVIHSEMKFFDYKNFEIELVTQYIYSLNETDEDTFFKNLSIYLIECIGHPRYIEVFNIIKVIILGDVNYPNVVAMTYGDGKCFRKESQSLKIRGILTKYYNIIRKILIEENFYEDVVEYVPSKVIKLYNKKNSKQLIYKDLVSEYGQDEGLIIYNLIKNLLV